jgi:pimeloyl-ACP methyl ester carboxylesterase
MAIAAVNGVELYYEQRGSGQPILLVHGTGAYSALWAPVVDGLARTYRVITYDRRGFARSRSGTPARLADHARDAAALLEALNASPAVVVGWSGGGVVALDLASSYPDRVVQLVLAEPAVNMSTRPTRSSLAMSTRSSVQRFLGRDKPEAARTMYRWASGYATGGNAFDGFPDAWQQQMSDNAPSTLREMDQLLRPYPSRRAVRSISCPVTVLEGDLSDPAFAKAATYVRDLLPHARTVGLTGAAHMLQIDQPEQWVDAVAALVTPT